MRSRVLETARKTSPVDLRLIIYGIAAGVIAGSFKLSDSAEEATATGIAWFIQISVGFWVGTKVWLFTLDVISGRLARIAERLAALESRFTLSKDPVEGRRTERPAVSNTINIVRLCVRITPIGIWLVAFGAISALLDFRANVHPTALYYLPELVLGAVLLSMGLAGQCCFLWWTERRLDRLEQRADAITQTVPFISQTQQIREAFDRAQSLVCKIAGARLSA